MSLKEREVWLVEGKWECILLFWLRVCKGSERKGELEGLVWCFVCSSNGQPEEVSTNKRVK